MKRVEASEFCVACKGYCCLHAPGKFAPEDFAPLGALDGQVIHDALDSGRAVMYTSFTNIEGSEAAPIFTLAARGIDREPLSLCHEALTCAHLEGDSCTYTLEERPLECAALVPSKNFPYCMLPDDMIIEPLWVEHQGLLREVIEQRCGRSWREELLAQMDERRHMDAYAAGAFELVCMAGLAESSSRVDAIIAAWVASIS
ncbi:MAG: hypothetical protein FWG24_05960 [Eggerthellaceae bacterium]|jgi:hypothetical protein|nr:hypothetical protein [Eggerthellaceae bacterium]MDR2721403.1 hypothetical protein [Coriobacteriaceae bacterium]